MSTDYWMGKYIFESTDALKTTLSVNEDCVKELFLNLNKRAYTTVVLTGLGSSLTAARIAYPYFIKFCKFPTFILPANEISQWIPNVINEKTLVVVVSRSGERGYVIDSVKAAKSAGALTIAITAYPDNLLTQEAHHSLITQEGDEISFPKTKSVTTCSGLLMRMALELSVNPDSDDVTAQKRALELFPGIVRRCLPDLENQVKAIIPSLLKYSYVHITGTGGNYGGALEFGIKLPEAVNIPVIANDTGSALHGAWGFLDEKWLNIFLVSDNDFEISQKILTLSKNYQGSSLIITQENLRKKIIGEMELRLPDFPDPLTVGLYYLFPLQLLVYHWAISTGQNPDVPKGLDHMLKAILPDGRQEPEFRK